MRPRPIRESLADVVAWLRATGYLAGSPRRDRKTMTLLEPGSKKNCEDGRLVLAFSGAIRSNCVGFSSDRMYCDCGAILANGVFSQAGV